MAPYVREKVDAFEKEQLEAIRAIDSKALDLYAKAAEKANAKAEKKGEYYNPREDTGDNFSAVKRYLTSFSVETAQKQFKAWKKLEETLLVKYIDGNVKGQDKDGSFIHSDLSVHMSGKIEHPEYTDIWKENVAKTHGEVIEEKELQ
jgi:hypothetical protein